MDELFSSKDQILNFVFEFTLDDETLFKRIDAKKNELKGVTGEIISKQAQQEEHQVYKKRVDDFNATLEPVVEYYKS